MTSAQPIAIMDGIAALRQYSKHLGFNYVEPDRNSSKFSSRAYVVASKAIELGIKADSDTVVATVDEEFVIESTKSTEPKKAVLKEVKGWKAVQMIAEGGFRFATEQERKRVVEERLERDQVCKKIEEDRPENRDRAIMREAMTKMADNVSSGSPSRRPQATEKG